MRVYAHRDWEPHAVVAAAASDMVDRPDEEAGSVLSTAKSYLALYRDPVVAVNVGASLFRVRDPMHADSPVSPYIVTQPNDKARLRPLVRVLINMIVRMLADNLDFENGWPKAHYKHRLLGRLDKFPSLGKLEILQESMAFVAGYGIKLYLICQDLNQLKSRETGYGPDETITSNCHVQNAYPPNRIETAEHLSKPTGHTTVVKEQITTSGKRAGVLLGRVSRTTQEVQRPLLTVDECLHMPGPRKNADGEIERAGDMAISVAGFPAIYGKQPPYFQNATFQARAAVPAPKVSDRMAVLSAMAALAHLTGVVFKTPRPACRWICTGRSTRRSFAASMSSSARRRLPCSTRRRVGVTCMPASARVINGRPGSPHWWPPATTAPGKTCCGVPTCCWASSRCVSSSRSTNNNWSRHWRSHKKSHQDEATSLIDSPARRPRHSICSLRHCAIPICRCARWCVAARRPIHFRKRSSCARI